MSTKSPYTGREMSTLGNVATYINGRAFKPSEWENRGLPIIRIQNLTNPSAPYNYSSSELEEKYKVRKGDLLFAWSASLGAHIWKGNDAWLNQHIFRVVPSEKIEKKYLYYFLLQVVAELYAKTHGSGMVHITKGPFMNTPIPVPSLPEQKRIVSKIEELFSKLDASVAELQTAKEKLKVYRQAVYSSVYDELRDLQPITNFFEITGGLTKNSRRNELPLQMPYLRVANVYYNHLDLSEIKEIGVTEQEIDRCLLEKNDLLFVEGNGSKAQIGRVAIWNGQIPKCLHQNHIVKGRPLGNMLSEYALYYLISNEGRKQIVNVAKSTSGLYTLSTNKIKGLRVPYCDLNDQKRILDDVKEKLSVYDSIEYTIDTSLQQAEALRQSILKQAFEGELKI